jgi:hypothetical protein
MAEACFLNTAAPFLFRVVVTSVANRAEEGLSVL